jgi:DNA-binding IclR family transcriptional regulator
VRVLDYLARLNRPAGVRQLATALNLSKSNSQRVLATLETQGVVEQAADTGRYMLGWRVLALSSAYTRSNRLIQVSRSIMAHLTEQTGETSCLHVPVPGGRVPVLQFESPHELLFLAQVGKNYPLYLGAAGKVLLAHLPDDVITDELARCAADRGLEFAERVERELPVIRAAGHAKNRGEDFPDVYGVAAPVFASYTGIAASLSVYGPGSRLDEAGLSTLEGRVLAAAREISTLLGEPGVT